MKTVFFLIFFIQFVFTQGFIDYNYYYDTREKTELTINKLYVINSSFNFFGFVNYSNAFKTENKDDLEGFYSENNLRWKFNESLPFSLTGQWVLVGGEKNDAFRLGLLWHVNESFKDVFKSLGGWYIINLHPYQFDFFEGHHWQIEHAYRVSFFKGKFYINGFFDHNFDSEGNLTTVTEHQFGVSVVGNLSLVVELRRNAYLKGNENGVGIGLEYFMGF